MIFKDTWRFQPVLHGDLPFKYDLFHYSFHEVPTTEKEFIKFIKGNNIKVDVTWWNNQWRRCRDGYEIEDVVEKGGDCYVDGEDAIWHGDDVYIPELDIILRGRKLWIPGRMYFYLNFWNIYRLDSSLGRKLWGLPRFTMLSWENWVIRDKAIRIGKDILWAKRRQMGASSEEAADLAYDLLMLKDVQLGLVAWTDPYVQITFNMVKQGIERLRNTQFYKWMSVNNNELLRTKYTNAELHARSAKDNVQCLSGLTPYKVKYEEIGLWKKGSVKRTQEFVYHSLKTEGKKTGYNIFIGTGGELEEGVDDMEKMFYAPDEYNLMKFPNVHEKEQANRGVQVARFVPGWKFEVLDRDGNIMKQESIKLLEEERSSKGYKERMDSIVLKPLYPSELFSITGGSFFGEQIVLWLNERKAYLHTHKMENLGRYYRLEWVDKNDWFKGVEAIEDDNGEFFIIELPYVENGVPIAGLYVAGTDPYDKDEAYYSESKGSIHIFKTFLNANSTYKMWVARLTERPKAEEGGAIKFYEDTVKLCMFYNATNLIEYSNIRILHYYEQKGVSYLLKERPEVVSSKYITDSKMTNIYGIDPSTKIHWLNALKDFLSDKKNIDKLYDIEQINAFAKFRYDHKHKYNCDITISSALSIVCYEDEYGLDIFEREIDSTQRDKVLVYKKDSRGNLKRVLV